MPPALDLHSYRKQILSAHRIAHVDAQGFFRFFTKTMIDLYSVDEYHASLPRVETRAS
jgi:hypothetical protein